MKKVSKQRKTSKVPRKRKAKGLSLGRSLEEDLISTSPSHMGSIKPAQPIPVYEVRERREVSDRGIGQLLSQARMQWQFAEWERLCQIDLLHIEHHPDRAELALLAGCGALQLGEQEKAATYLKAARDWDCDERVMFQLLLSGVHNSLGRYHAMKGNEEKAEKMLQLGGVGLGGDEALISEIRRSKESSRLGLCERGRNQNNPELPAPKVEEGRSEEENIEEEFSMEKAIEEASKAESHFKEGITSYAQNFEDVMLWRALGHIKNGFYIDIGAHDPIIDSVSKAFYEKGWRGIHVEALSEYARKLKTHRPDETVIHAAVSNHHGKIAFYKTEGVGGLSTGCIEYLNSYLKKDYKLERIELITLTLFDIFELVSSKEIHWLKIDVEGMERSVIEGWGRSVARPWVIVVESTLPNSRIETPKDWEDMLNIKNYRFVYFDGLNRYYLRGDKADLIKCFKTPPNVFDDFKLNK